MSSSPANRERRFAVALLLALGVGATACGSDGGDGPPQTGSYDDSEILESVMGTCRKLCCSDSDCDGGGQCVAFDSAFGTLGACTTASSASSWPTGAALPEGCWTGGTAICQPITNEGCDEGESCDLDEGDEWLDPMILCSPGMEAPADGEACDAVYGPACGAGYHCVPDP